MNENLIYLFPTPREVVWGIRGERYTIPGVVKTKKGGHPWKGPGGFLRFAEASRTELPERVPEGLLRLETTRNRVAPSYFNVRERYMPMANWLLMVQFLGLLGAASVVPGLWRACLHHYQSKDDKSIGD